MGVITIEEDKKRVDWHQVRAEYVNGLSLRKLSEKYGISFSTIQQKSMREKWTESRKAAKIKIEENVIQKTAEKAADNAIIFERMRQKALLKLERELDAVLDREGTESRHTETYYSEEDKRTVSDTTISKLADILALMDKISGAGFGTNEPQLKAIREILDGVDSAID